jgi:hypothetical protein
VKRWPIIPAVAALAVASCAAYVPPASSAPQCPADSSDIYVVLGSQLPCKLRPGQRVVVAMPHANGSPEALQTICFSVFHGTVFVHNYGNYDYCALARTPA